MKFLVTGGAGFIGSAVVRALRAQGHAVRVLDNFSTGRKENLAEVASAIEIVAADICDRNAIAKALIGITHVCHLAARVSVPGSWADPVLDEQVNCGGTVLLLQEAVAAGVKRFVYSSSAAVYGDNSALPLKEDALPKPQSPYGVSKLAGEIYSRAYNGTGGLETVALRYFNVYGPRQDPSSSYSGVISRFMAALSENKAPVIHGDGGQTRDFVYVEDVAAANLCAQLAPSKIVAGRVYNVAGGQVVSVLKLLELMRAEFGGGHEPRYEPVRAGDIRHSHADLSRIQVELQYRPGWNLQDGLRRTIDWFQGIVSAPQIAEPE